jgi:hypothetical protein
VCQHTDHDSIFQPMAPFHCKLPAVLGNPETDWPPFTANVVVELWHSKHSDTEQNLTSTGASSARGGNVPRKLGSQAGTSQSSSPSPHQVEDVALEKHRSKFLVRVLYNKDPLRLTSPRNGSRPGGVQWQL